MWKASPCYGVIIANFLLVQLFSNISCHCVQAYPWHHHIIRDNVQKAVFHPMVVYIFSQLVWKMRVEMSSLLLISQQYSGTCVIYGSGINLLIRCSTAVRIGWSWLVNNYIYHTTVCYMMIVRMVYKNIVISCCMSRVNSLRCIWSKAVDFMGVTRQLLMT